jgi:hypothetical protein
MSDYTKEEISEILRTAEILKKKGSSQKLNISEFCKEARISRKNAYKHKKKINPSLEAFEQKVQRLKNEKEDLEKKLHHSEKRAREADLYWQCRCILVELNRDYKKNGHGRTPRRLKLIDDYNRISGLLGFEPLSCWE